jgi:diguanylate cyclase (GGDEF)-like protein
MSDIGTTREETIMTSQPADFGSGLGQKEARPIHMVGALITSVLTLAATLWLLPYSNRVLPTAAWFLPATVSLAFFADWVTGLLLLLQFRRTGRWGLLAVSFAYFFASWGMAAQLLVYPGVFSQAGLFGASQVSAPWVWLTWHFAYAVSIFVAAVIIPVPRAPENRRGLVAKVVLAAPIVIVSAATVVAVRWGTELSHTLSRADYLRPVHGPMGLVVWAMGLVALIALGIKTKFRSLLQLWTGVSVLAFLCETAMMLTSLQRFTVGWYFSRGIIVVSSTLLLSALLFEIDGLYSAAYVANRVLRERSIRDSLTGVFLRRYLTEQLATELGRSRRKKEPLSFLLLDIDWFKQYNDQFGHQAGDDCLVAVCEAAQKHLRRHGDFLARYGGEEFAIVLPNTPVGAATELADRIREEIANLQMYPRGRETAAGVTVSIGVATHEGDADLDERSLLEAADLALYQAKHAGRNRVVVHEEAIVTASEGTDRRTVPFD